MNSARWFRLTHNGKIYELALSEKSPTAALFQDGKQLAVKRLPFTLASKADPQTALRALRPQWLVTVPPQEFTPAKVKSVAAGALNEGTVAKFQRDLAKFSKQCDKQILSALRDRGYQTAVTQKVRAVYKALIPQFTAGANALAKQYAGKFSAEATNDLAKHLLKAGMNREAFKQWTFTVLGKRTVAPAAVTAIDDFIQGTVALLMRRQWTSAQSLPDLVKKVTASGGDYDEIARLFTHKTDYKARMAGRDLGHKLVSEVTRQDAKAAGIRYARWVHVAGLYTSRPTHVAMNGKRYDLDLGMYDPAVGFRIQVGQLLWCRCICNLEVTS